MDGVSVIVKKGDRFLMVQNVENKPFPLKWLPVSGSIERGETPELAAIREVREETGLDIEVIEEVVRLEAGYKTERVHFINAEWEAGEVKTDKGEIRDYGWFAREEILRLDLVPATKEFFDKHFRTF